MNDLYLDRHLDIKITKGKLPHWHQDGKLVFATFRLADSMPQTVLADMQREKDAWLAAHPAPWTKETEREYRERFSAHVDKWLDAGYGSCILKDAGIASIVKDAMLFYHGQQYHIHAYVIMPNHVHVLVEVHQGFEMQKILQSWKSYSSHAINKALNKSGSVWGRESYDRIIRDDIHYLNVKGYIRKNIWQGAVLWHI